MSITPHSVSIIGNVVTITKTVRVCAAAKDWEQHLWSGIYAHILPDCERGYVREPEFSHVGVWERYNHDTGRSEACEIPAHLRAEKHHVEWADSLDGPWVLLDAHASEKVRRIERVQMHTYTRICTPAEYELEQQYVRGINCHLPQKQTA